MKITQAVAKRTRDLLIENKISQYRLEKNMNIHHGTMTGIMSTKNSSMNLKTVLQICKGLGVTPEQFFADPIFTSDELDI